MATQIDHLTMMGNPPAEQMSMTPYGTPAQGCTRQQIWADGVNSNRMDVPAEWDMDEDTIQLIRRATISMLVKQTNQNQD